jgi:hypothetical protein
MKNTLLAATAYGAFAALIVLSPVGAHARSAPFELTCEAWGPAQPYRLDVIIDPEARTYSITDISDLADPNHPGHWEGPATITTKIIFPTIDGMTRVMPGIVEISGSGVRFIRYGDPSWKWTGVMVSPSGLRNPNGTVVNIPYNCTSDQLAGHTQANAAPAYNTYADVQRHDAEIKASLPPYSDKALAAAAESAAISEADMQKRPTAPTPTPAPVDGSPAPVSPPAPAPAPGISCSLTDSRGNTLQYSFARGGHGYTNETVVKRNGATISTGGPMWTRVADKVAKIETLRQGDWSISYPWDVNAGRATLRHNDNIVASGVCDVSAKLVLG